MAKKMTTAIATDMVNRIEALQDQINTVYREAYAYGKGDENVIRDAVKARKELREAEYNASALLESFDAPDAD